MSSASMMKSVLRSPAGRGSGAFSTLSFSPSASNSASASATSAASSPFSASGESSEARSASTCTPRTSYSPGPLSTIETPFTPSAWLWCG